MRRPGQKPCEYAQYFALGETISGSKYFWMKDFNSSIVALLDNSGNVQFTSLYDPYGREQISLGSIQPDFGFDSYFRHTRSQLNVTGTRAYNPSFGRFISRDPIAERGGANLFDYVQNSPVTWADPSGLAPQSANGGTTWYIPSGVESRWGGKPGSFGLGCIAVVDAMVGLDPGILPENHLPPGSECWWGNGTDPTEARKKACAHKCPPNTRPVVWCKQGILWGTAGTAGSQVTDPSGIWNNGSGGSGGYSNGNFNYTGYIPGNSQPYRGINGAGGCAYTSTSPQGNSSEYNGSMCCTSCIP